MRNDKQARDERYKLRRRMSAVDQLGQFGQALLSVYREAGFDPWGELNLPPVPTRTVLDQLQNPWADRISGGISVWELLTQLRSSPWIQIEPGRLGARGYLGEPRVRLRSTENRNRLSRDPFEALARSLTA